MARHLTDEQVEAEIAQLREDEDVILAKKYAAVRSRRRQYLEGLRTMKKEGQTLRKAGIRLENLEDMLEEEEIV